MIAPELQVLAINATCLAVGYLGIYPSLKPLTATRVAFADLGVCLVAVLTSAVLFWSSDHAFRLLWIEAHALVFAVVTLVAMEIPLSLWFLRRHGLLDRDD